MSLIVPVYYKLHDLFENSINRQGVFSRLDRDMIQAVRRGMAKFRKYYRRMDANDTYYAALILDPRVKGELLKKNLSDEVAARDFYENTRELKTEPLIRQWWREGRTCAHYHKDRDVRKMPIFVSCVKVFADDTSGNVSKQWNKHENQYLSHENLPRYMASMQSHVHFLSTSPAL